MDIGDQEENGATCLPLESQNNGAATERPWLVLRVHPEDYEWGWGGGQRGGAASTAGTAGGGLRWHGVVVPHSLRMGQVIGLNLRPVLPSWRVGALVDLPPEG